MVHRISPLEDLHPVCDQEWRVAAFTWSQIFWLKAYIFHNITKVRICPCILHVVANLTAEPFASKTDTRWESCPKLPELLLLLMSWEVENVGDVIFICPKCSLSLWFTWWGSKDWIVISDKVSLQVKAQCGWALSAPAYGYFLLRTCLQEAEGVHESLQPGSKCLQQKLCHLKQQLRFTVTRDEVQRTAASTTAPELVRQRC